MKPAIMLYIMAMLTFLTQLIYILIYWEDMAVKLREYLKFYCTDVESALSQELAVEQVQHLDATQTHQDIQIWQQIETMITDDQTWEESTKGYLMTVMSGVCMVNVLFVSWFCWILLAQMTWMARRGIY